MCIRDSTHTLTHAHTHTHTHAHTHTHTRTHTHTHTHTQTHTHTDTQRHTHTTILLKGFDPLHCRKRAEETEAFRARLCAPTVGEVSPGSKFCADCIPYKKSFR